MRRGCVSGGDLGSVLLGGNRSPPSQISLLDPAGQASLRGWEKGRHCPNVPNATNNSFSFTALSPSWTEGVVGMELGGQDCTSFPFPKVWFPL